MSYPPNYGPPQQPYGAPPPPAGNDKVTLWGVLGIVFAFCCMPLGILFAILSIVEAKKWRKSPVLGYVGIGIAVFALIVNIILYATGALSYNFSTS